MSACCLVITSACFEGEPNMAIHAGMVGCALCLGEAGAEAAAAEAHWWQAGAQMGGASADLAVLFLFPKMP